jgi:ribosomal protein S18 acetylase RimI-like enzyme
MCENIFIFPLFHSKYIIMIIRRAISSDIESVVEFQVKMAAETEGVELYTHTVHEGVFAVFQHTEKGVYYVAEADQQVVASTLLTPEWSDWRNAMVYWIQSVYVLPEYRRKGVFRQMFATIEKAVQKDEKSAGLRLYVDKNNLEAISVYEKLGMNGDHYRLFEKMKE